MIWWNRFESTGFHGRTYQMIISSQDCSREDLIFEIIITCVLQRQFIRRRFVYKLVDYTRWRLLGYFNLLKWILWQKFWFAIGGSNQVDWIKWNQWGLFLLQFETVRKAVSIQVSSIFDLATNRPLVIGMCARKVHSKCISCTSGTGENCQGLQHAETIHHSSPV